MKTHMIDELKVITPDKFVDHRGIYIETFNDKQFQEISDIKFIQDDFSKSTKGVFRGLHGDMRTWKLVSCSHGKIKLLILNCNLKSPYFGKSYKFELSPEDYFQVLIPPMYANGHEILTGEGIFNYKQSTYYGDNKQFSINISSPVLGKLSNDQSKLILSERDLGSEKVENIEELKKYIEGQL